MGTSAAGSHGDGVRLAIDESRATDAADTAGVFGGLSLGRVAYVCSGCGYGISVGGHLPTCPMCGGDAWQPEPGARRAPDDLPA